MSSSNKFNEKIIKLKITKQGDFYSFLNNDHISDDQYKHAN